MKDAARSTASGKARFEFPRFISGHSRQVVHNVGARRSLREISREDGAIKRRIMRAERSRAGGRQVFKHGVSGDYSDAKPRCKRYN